MAETHVVVLAAGKGTRMKSVRPKVLHNIAGIPLIEHVLHTAATLAPASTTVVVGHQAANVERALARQNGLTFVVQEPQLGTAHALLTAESALTGKAGTLILLSGDVPLLSAQTLKTLRDRHESTHAAATVVTAVVDDPHGYGRIVRVGEQIARIVEEKDATSAERQIHEINSGIYAFALEGLFDAVRSIAAENAQREYYLPDLVAIFQKRGSYVGTVTVDNADEIRGINSRSELASLTKVAREQKAAALMTSGVTIEDPATAYIDRDVAVGADTIIHPNVTLSGQTTIGSGCEIHSGVRIVDSVIGDHVVILDHCLITSSRVDARASLGPFAHLRNGADVREGAHIGNFVELKKTVFGKGSKAGHLAYLGDATVGEKVNIGAGTITCNYDGEKKNQTVIEDGAFIGSDTQLVAPVTVGKGAYVGSGATIREDVPPESLAVSAGKQRNIDGWVKNRKKRGG
ncbi:MAG TPA: bifunctional UDP-N-acetylglucosamine diphosphorylase/glucosamine-1-phosphate N-acetyltransferase GlmU [Vicinamibacterales bacterium]|nr:bifunctional UDP-N-acetylglucosamine diphosphorylase/glucosamine-1-phosphate N-acetyltransferase GlmU [Vicinamibacterales bacterium]